MFIYADEQHINEPVSLLFVLSQRAQCALACFVGSERRLAQCCWVGSSAKRFSRRFPCAVGCGKRKYMGCVLLVGKSLGAHVGAYLFILGTNVVVGLMDTCA